MKNLILIIVMMAVVTYLPRLIPMVMLKDLKLPLFLKTFLNMIPFAVLGALIFPGILFSTGCCGSALFGGLIAVILAYFNLNIILVVFGGISGVMFYKMLF